MAINNKHYLAIAAICRNEERYLPDWITYHQKLGVTHFYLWENESQDKTWQLINSYPKALITPHQIKGAAKQGPAYNQCLHKYRGYNRWIAFIDVDEYIVPIKDDNLIQLLRKYEEYPALCAHWKLFGSNGYKSFENKPVVERFTRCQPNINPHVKSIVNPMKTRVYHTPHRFKHNGPAVDENKTNLAPVDPLPANGTCNIIQINHYSTKSEEECLQRKSYVRADTGTKWNAEEFFKHHDRNEVEDLRARELWRL